MDKHRSVRSDNSIVNYGIAILCCTIIFTAIELKHPYFFLRDDNAVSYLTEYMYGVNCISEGKFPLYCFNTLCGQRFFAVGQTCLFNPLLFIAVCLSRLICGKADMIIDILAYFSIIIGCTGAYILLKKLGCNDISAIIGSIVWVYNCYNVWMGDSWMIVVYTTSVFPFFLITSMLLLEKSSIRNISFAIFIRVYMFYLGHPQFFIFAAIFDCIFIGVLCLIKYKKDRFYKLALLIRDFIITYFSTTILSLPLLIPEYELTQLSLGYGSSGSSDSLTNEMQISNPAFFFPYLYNLDNSSVFFPPFIGYFLFIFLVLAPFLIIYSYNNKAYSRLKPLCIYIIAALPCFFLGYLILLNLDALKIISYIPILNRFQYYHRITVFFSSFEIIISCVSLTIACSMIKAKIDKHPCMFQTIKLTVISIEVLSFVLLYTLTPHIGRGPLYNTAKLYDYDFAEQFSSGRYLPVGYKIKTASDDKKEIADLSENLNYNLAKLYRINNVSGYFCMLSTEEVLINNECFLHMYYINGNVYEYYPGLIEQMREQSVCWYIICPASRMEFEGHFKEYGLEYVSETEHSVIYYDPFAQPYAYDSNGDEIALIQDTNSLLLNTTNDYQGGIITLNYTYDPYFKCYIDGKPATIINDAENWQFKIECGPGQHSIIIQYEDPAFITCCLIAVGYAALALSVIAIYQRRKYSKPKTNEVC